MLRLTICCIVLLAMRSVSHAEDAKAGDTAGALLFENSDFESGDLTNWIVEGTAFGFQPTRGDNVHSRSAGLTDWVAGHQGEWWVGTYERFQGRPGEAAGQTQGDEPTGSILSADFIIREPYITFLVGGGGSAHTTVRLIVGGELVRSASGRGREEMHRVFWNVEEFFNRKGMIHIQDAEKGPWGHINADDFRATTQGPRLLFPNSDFENGDLTNWTAEGPAFTSQPTRGDNPAVRSKAAPAQPEGEWWVGTYENYQGKEGQKSGTVQDDLPTGTLRSVPFEITGNRIGFLVGGGSREELAVQLQVDDKVVHSARGNRSELLQPVTWDVAPYKGKTAIIAVVDNADSRWGHINVDSFHYIGD